MKFRYFLRGLGVGILFASIIFVVAYNSVSHDSLSDEEIIKRAKTLGMVETNDIVADVIGKDKTTEELKNDTKTSTEDKNTKNDMEENTQPKTEQKTETNTKPEEDKENNKDNETYEITVEYGSSSYPVCQKLYSLGLIDNAEEFDNYLIEHGYASKISVGTHSIKKGMSYEEIAIAISDKD